VVYLRHSVSLIFVSQLIQSFIKLTTSSLKLPISADLGSFAVLHVGPTTALVLGVRTLFLEEIKITFTLLFITIEKNVSFKYYNGLN